MKMTRIISLLAVGVAFFTFFVGCNKDDNNKDEHGPKEIIEETEGDYTVTYAVEASFANKVLKEALKRIPMDAIKGDTTLTFKGISDTEATLTMTVKGNYLGVFPNSEMELTATGHEFTEVDEHKARYKVKSASLRLLKVSGRAFTAPVQPFSDITTTSTDGVNHKYTATTATDTTAFNAFLKGFKSDQNPAASAQLDLIAKTVWATLKAANTDKVVMNFAIEATGAKLKRE